MGRIITINILLAIALLLMLEGAASLFLASRSSQGGVASPNEARHTRFDPLLGWINKPGLRMPDLYGEGVYFHTNGSGFRNSRDFAVQTADDRQRIICVGDSFTLGYGVNNHQTWCHLLSQNMAKVETVNMGQGGYGIDQAYLWYRRDGVKLQHDLVVFAFITADFYRLQQREFGGFSKPFLSLENDEIRVRPPSSRDGQAARGEAAGLASFVAKLRIAEFIKKLVWKIRLIGSSDGVLSKATEKLTSALFRDLKKITVEQHAELLLVHLPNADDYPANRKTDALRGTLRRISMEQGLKYVDLVESVQSLPSEFDAQLLYQYGNRHFNLQGNNFVARRLQPEIHNSLALD